MGKVTGLRSDLAARQVTVPADRSRLCPGPHPDPEQLEELVEQGFVRWYWQSGLDASGTPFHTRIFDCVLCHGSGVVQLEEGEVDRDQQKHLKVEPLPVGHPALSQREWSPSWGGSGPRR